MSTKQQDYCGLDPALSAVRGRRKYLVVWQLAFATDACARRILGRRVAATMATSIVLDSIDHAIWTRQQDGVSDLNDVVHHTDRGSQHMSIRFTQRLADAGIHPAVGAVGSSMTMR